ncbi:MAG: MFS transporter [Candidatus Heimdallarchaeota archaeon]|nr:MFS transporter [Candidatus Heimdallarchaeota archaeon]
MNARLVSHIKTLVPPKNLLPVLFSYTLDSIAKSLYWTFFAIWLSETLTDSFFILSVVLAIPPMISLLGITVFSSYSDRSGRRKEVMFLSRIVLMVQFILLIFFDQSIWIVLLILGSTGIFTQIYYVMNNTLATTICPVDRRGEVSSFQLFFSSFGWMIGSGLSGVVYENFGITGCLIIAAGGALLSGIVALFSANTSPSPESPPSIDRTNKEPTEPLTTDEQELSSEKFTGVDGSVRKSLPVHKITSTKTVTEPSSFWKILTRKRVLILLLAMGIMEFGLGPFSIMGTVYLKQIGGLSNYLISLANTLATLIGLILLLFIGRLIDKRGRKPFILASFLSYSIYFFLFYFLSPFSIAIFILWLVPLYALRTPAVNAMMSDLTSEKERARGMALIQYEQVFTTNIGAIIGGLLVDRIALGLKIIPLSVGGFAFIAFIIALFFIQETFSKKAIIQGAANKDH